MWGFAAGILVLLGLAIAFSLWPWWTSPHRRRESMDEILTQAYRMRRDELQEDVEIGWLSPELFGEAEAELDHGLLSDIRGIGEDVSVTHKGRRITPALILIVTIASLGLYLVSSDLARLALLGGVPDEDEAVVRMQSRLETQLQDNPQDAQAWAQLAELHRIHGRNEQAVEAWGRVNEISNFADPSALVALADALAVAGGDRFSQQAVDYLLQALIIDPEHQKALWLAGWAAWQREESEAAIRYWDHLLEVLPEEEEGVRAMVSGWLAKARGIAVSEAEERARLNLKIRLSDGLKAQINPDWALFVYAKDASGMPMPLAVWRGTAADLPLDVTLDDTSAMAPNAPRLSDAEAVLLSARISVSGDAIRRSGDFIGTVGPIPLLEADGTEVVIDARVP